MEPDLIADSYPHHHDVTTLGLSAVPETFSHTEKVKTRTHLCVCVYIPSIGAEQRKLPGAVPRGRPVPPPLPRGGCGGLLGGASV